MSEEKKQRLKEYQKKKITVRLEGFNILINEIGTIVYIDGDKVY